MDWRDDPTIRGRRAIVTGGAGRMGSDPLAVVDAGLRVPGLDGLRVVDAAVMPRIVSGNTNMATIMIAERASDLILGRPVLRRRTRRDDPLQPLPARGDRGPPPVHAAA